MIPEAEKSSPNSLLVTAVPLPVTVGSLQPAGHIELLAVAKFADAFPDELLAIAADQL